VKGLGPKEEDLMLLNSFINSNYSQESLLEFMEFRENKNVEELK
jgi:hypothetical protein